MNRDHRVWKHQQNTLVLYASSVPPLPSALTPINGTEHTFMSETKRKKKKKEEKKTRKVHERKRVNNVAYTVVEKDR